MADEAIKRMSSKYFADMKTVARVKSAVAYVTSVLEDFEKNYWLAAGTLLGLYNSKFILYIKFFITIKKRLVSRLRINTSHVSLHKMKQS